MWKKFKRTIYSCYMCIKYPFLYPRNRFTGLHYNNWNIINKMKSIYSNYHKVNISDKPLEDMIPKDGYYIKYEKGNRIIQYWTNWWAYPLWRVTKFYHDVILQILHCIPTYNEWDAVEPGWNKAFGKQYLKELRQQLIKDKMLYSFRITQIKEKWGRLQLYCYKTSEDVYKIIDKYENLSWDYCIHCGKSAKYISKGWISPYCEDCINKDNINHYIKKGSEEEKYLP